MVVGYGYMDLLFTGLLTKGYQYLAKLAGNLARQSRWQAGHCNVMTDRLHLIV